MELRLSCAVPAAGATDSLCRTALYMYPCTGRATRGARTAHDGRVDEDQDGLPRGRRTYAAHPGDRGPDACETVASDAHAKILPVQLRSCEVRAQSSAGRRTCEADVVIGFSRRQCVRKRARRRGGARGAAASRACLERGRSRAPQGRRGRDHDGERRAKHGGPRAATLWQRVVACAAEDARPSRQCWASRDSLHTPSADRMKWASTTRVPAATIKHVSVGSEAAAP